MLFFLSADLLRGKGSGTLHPEPCMHPEKISDDHRAQKPQSRVWASLPWIPESEVSRKDHYMDPSSIMAMWLRLGVHFSAFALKERLLMSCSLRSSAILWCTKTGHEPPVPTSSRPELLNRPTQPLPSFRDVDLSHRHPCSSFRLISDVLRYYMKHHIG